MKIGLGIHDTSEERLRYAKQLGADGIFFSLQGLPEYATQGRASAAALADLKQRVASFGLEVLTLRIDPHRTAQVLSGGPGRDREIDDICATIRAAGEVGIPTVFYNLTPWRSFATAWPQTPGAPAPGEGDLRLGSGPGRYYREAGRGGAVLLTHSRERAAADTAQSPSEAVA